MDSLQQLKRKLRDFSQAREWDQFHSPKNLAMALAGESGELLECFQWLTEEESKRLDKVQYQAVTDELADVLLYVIRLADKLEIDLLTAATQKIKKNEQKYPAALVKGSSKKYTFYKKT